MAYSSLSLKMYYLNTCYNPKNLICTNSRVKCPFSAKKFSVSAITILNVSFSDRNNVINPKSPILRKCIVEVKLAQFPYNY